MTIMPFRQGVKFTISLISPTIPILPQNIHEPTVTKHKLYYLLLLTFSDIPEEGILKSNCYDYERKKHYFFLFAWWLLPFSVMKLYYRNYEQMGKCLLQSGPDSRRVRREREGEETQNKKSFPGLPHSQCRGPGFNP